MFGDGARSVRPQSPVAGGPTATQCLLFDFAPSSDWSLDDLGVLDLGLVLAVEEWNKTKTENGRFGLERRETGVTHPYRARTIGKR